MAGLPTREGVEQAVVLVATQTLVASDEVDVAMASPETLAYQIGALRRALRSMVLLFDIDKQR